MYTYKSFLFLFTFLFIAPSLVLADSYGGPFCFEKPSTSVDERNEYYDSEGIRGTCKEIKTVTVVSLDPVLQKDYFLGTHVPVGYGCYLGGCEGLTKYSEHLFLTSSLILKTQTTGVEESPFQYALFKKSYFVPVLSKIFKESGVSFSENNLPSLGITILKQSELAEIRKVDGDHILEGAKMDFLNTTEKHFYYPEEYNIYSFKYEEYGKYIYAPKGTLIESQYTNFEKSNNILRDKDLQIKTDGSYKNPVTVVPVTSPLESVTNYWMYTTKAGKITLTWQKSEYLLDNGQVKVLTKADKKITTTLLFSDSSDSVDPPSESAKKGLLNRLLDLILSWFR